MHVIGEWMGRWVGGWVGGWVKVSDTPDPQTHKLFTLCEEQTMGLNNTKLHMQTMLRSRRRLKPARRVELLVNKSWM